MSEDRLSNHHRKGLGMERLVDPLTTIDAKLWADEFMKVKARLGEQEFDHAMMLGWFANAIMQGYDEGQRRAKADAQATVEALQRELLEWKRALCGPTPGGSEFADDHAYCAEWVRKARENQHDIIISKHRKLKATQAALDAEREKVKKLEANQVEYEKCTDEQIVALNQGCLDYEKELSQLKTLVRAFFSARAVGDVEAYTKAFVEIKRTLDATTPAHEQTKATVFNEWGGALRQMADVEPKGGDGE